jgi:hypothetical protein
MGEAASIGMEHLLGWADGRGVVRIALRMDMKRDSRRLPRYPGTTRASVPVSAVAALKIPAQNSRLQTAGDSITFIAAAVRGTQQKRVGGLAHSVCAE